MNIVNGNFFVWLKVHFKVTFLLLAFNVILGIFSFLFSFLLFKGNDTLSLIFLGAQVLPGTEAPFSLFVVEYWRFISSAFLHGGLIHLVFNMYALVSIGGFVERYYGGKKLFTVYMITAFFASLLSFFGTLIEMWSNGGMAGGVAVSVGASGAIFGLVGLILGNRYLRKNTYGPELNIDTNSLIWVVVVNLLLGFSLNFFGTAVAVNNWAHIGGLIGGLILGAILDTKNTFDSGKAKKIFEMVLFVLSVIAFVASWGFNIFSMIQLSLSL